MLNTFDWLRRCDSGAELLATLRYFAKRPNPSPDEQAIGPPLSALDGPCQRCYVYARVPNQLHCQFCRTILDKANRAAHISRKTVIIYGTVSQLPKTWLAGGAGNIKYVIGIYLHDQNRFLAMLGRRKIKVWLQDLMLYHGAELRGLLQIFPPKGTGGNISMGDILCHASHYEPRVQPDRLAVQFYTSPFQLFRPRERERKGMLTFEAAEFLSLLEMAAVFRAKLYPHEQRQLNELLNLENPKEEQFYWGRFLGQLHSEAKDMLAAWRIRQWPKNRIQLLYELIDYAELPNTD
ncbi:MAG: hypothetical protein ONB44_06560 [candidate division KSB1 bacterium]|nr:hypothetical protein [candidate division KSB1 bacterium]MDZ7301785.1 hypothetical protein [candidate division KSB1 bacterium]MDZ7311436.1 hypothetical protein [candidate division KSB1 bacterium]